MGDIVIAYARPDEDAAELVMSKLKSLGYSVKGAEIAPPPLPRRTAKTADAPHVVLWSKHAAAAYAKGGSAARSGVIAARLDTAPVSSRLKTEAVDLRAWRGRDDHRGWRALVADVRTVAEPAKGKAAAKAAPAKSSAKAAPEKKKGGGMGIVLLTLAALAAAGGGAAYYLGLIP